MTAPPPTPGVFTVVIHASPGADHGASSGDGKGGTANVPTIIAGIKGAEAYTPGMPVRLVACYGGAGLVTAGPGGLTITQMPLAQRLADGLKAGVQASPNLLLSTGGALSEMSRSGQRAVQWQPFLPGVSPSPLSVIPNQ